MSSASAFVVWHCPANGHVNDQMRHVCRDCGAHRPCEHYDGVRHCGAVPVHMYNDGPRCAEHRVPIEAPARRALPDSGDGGRLVLDLPAEFTVGQWAGAIRTAADRIPRMLLGEDDRWRSNPARARAEREFDEALRSVAGVLGIPVCEVGPCGCGAYHHRYGVGAWPLCPPCRAVVEARRSGRVVSEGGNHGEPPARAA